MKSLTVSYLIDMSFMLRKHFPDIRKKKYFTFTRIAKSSSKRQKLLKSFRAQWGQALQVINNLKKNRKRKNQVYA